MADILKVDTQQLKSTASAVRGQIRRMQQDFDGLQNIVSRSSYYWQGQAADEYRQACAEQKDPTAEMLKRLADIPTALEKMAGVYEEAEADNEDTAGSLQTDYI